MWRGANENPQKRGGQASPFFVLPPPFERPQPLSSQDTLTLFPVGHKTLKVFDNADTLFLCLIKQQRYTKKRFERFV